MNTTAEFATVQYRTGGTKLWEIDRLAHKGHRASFKVSPDEIVITNTENDSVIAKILSAEVQSITHKGNMIILQAADKIHVLDFKMPVHTGMLSDIPASKRIAKMTAFMQQAGYKIN